MTALVSLPACLPTEPVESVVDNERKAVHSIEKTCFIILNKKRNSHQRTREKLSTRGKKEKNSFNKFYMTAGKNGKLCQFTKENENHNLFPRDLLI